MKIEMKLAGGATATYETGRLTGPQVEQLRRIAARAGFECWHVHTDRSLTSGRRGPWSVAWTEAGRIHVARIEPGGEIAREVTALHLPDETREEAECN